MAILFWLVLLIIFGVIYFLTKDKEVTNRLPEIWDTKVSSSDLLHIVISEPKINENSLVKVSPTTKTMFRPQTLTEYIGQARAKELIKLNIEKITRFKPIHIFLSGDKGHGKTTLANIIANMLHAQFIQRIGSQMTDVDDVIEVLNLINTSEELWTVLFLDEIHTMKCKPELFYTIMEDFKLAGQAIKPFTLIGATTEKNVFAGKYEPFLDRFQCIELEPYKNEDIVAILSQYKRQMWNSLPDNAEHLRIISENCKRTPRIAITLLEDTLVVNDITKILKYHDIVINGLTSKDIQLLRLLRDINKPVGEDALSQAIGINKKDYKTLHEPYLAKEQYIIRTGKGRIITAKGLALLATL
jgi:Holliday junction DNA helicase RuvB